MLGLSVAMEEALAKVREDLGRGNEKPKEDHREWFLTGRGTRANLPMMGHHLSRRQLDFP